MTDRRHRPPCGILLAAALTGCAGSKPLLPDIGPPVDLERVDLAPWSPVGTAQRYSTRDIALLVGERAPDFLAYNFEEAQVLAVARGEARAEIMLARFRTTEEAFGLYSAGRADLTTVHPVDGEGAVVIAGGGSVRAWKGRYCVRARSIGEAPVPEVELMGLARPVLAAIVELSRKPKLVRALPADALVQESECFFRTAWVVGRVWDFRQPDLLGLGDASGGSRAAEGVYAQFVFAADEANVFVIRYREHADGAKAADRFVELYRSPAATYQDRGSLREVEFPGGAAAIALVKGALVILVPPTRASFQVKEMIREYLDNLLDPEV